MSDEVKEAVPLPAHDGELVEFDDKLKREVYSRDLGRCQFCGAHGDDIAHIKHRGMGGKKSVNKKSNLITLCRDHHTRLDKGQFLIHSWDPDDKENGLIVWSSEKAGFLNKDELYFYSIPSCQEIEDSHYAHQKLLDDIGTLQKDFFTVLEDLYYIREKEKFKIPDQNGEFYTSFDDYYENEVKYHLSIGSIKTYLSAVPPLLERGESLEEFNDVKRGNLPILGTILNADYVPEEEKDSAVAMARENREEDFRKHKRDLQIKYKGAKRVKTCKDCMHPDVKDLDEFEVDGTTYKFGDRSMLVCGKTGYILNTMSSTYAQDQAESCDHFEPKD